MRSGRKGARVLDQFGAVELSDDGERAVMLLIRHNGPVLKEDRRVIADWIKVRTAFLRALAAG